MRSSPTCLPCSHLQLSLGALRRGGDAYCEAWRGVAWQTIERDPTNADEWHIYVGEARRVTVARRVVSNNTVHLNTLTQA